MYYRPTPDAAAALLIELSEQGVDADLYDPIEPIVETESLPLHIGDTPDVLWSQPEKLERYLTAVDQLGELKAQWAYKPAVGYPNKLTVLVTHLEKYLYCFGLHQADAQHPHVIEHFNAFEEARQDFLKGDDDKISLILDLEQQAYGDVWLAQVANEMIDYSISDFEGDRTFGTVLKHACKWAYANRYTIGTYRVKLFEEVEAESEAEIKVFEKLQPLHKYVEEILSYERM